MFVERHRQFVRQRKSKFAVEIDRNAKPLKGRKNVRKKNETKFVDGRAAFVERKFDCRRTPRPCRREEDVRLVRRRLKRKTRRKSELSFRRVFTDVGETRKMKKRRVGRRIVTFDQRRIDQRQMINGETRSVLIVRRDEKI